MLANLQYLQLSCPQKLKTLQPLTGVPPGKPSPPGPQPRRWHSLPQASALGTPSTTSTTVPLSSAFGAMTRPRAPVPLADSLPPLAARSTGLGGTVRLSASVRNTVVGVSDPNLEIRRQRGSVGWHAWKGMAGRGTASDRRHGCGRLTSIGWTPGGQTTLPPQGGQISARWSRSGRGPQTCKWAAGSCTVRCPRRRAPAGRHPGRATRRTESRRHSCPAQGVGSARPLSHQTRVSAGSLRTRGSGDREMMHAACLGTRLLHGKHAHELLQADRQG